MPIIITSSIIRTLVPHLTILEKRLVLTLVLPHTCGIIMSFP